MHIFKKQKNPSKYLGNELKYIKKVLASESWSATGGSWSNKLEKEFANLYSAKFAVAMNSGTATFHCDNGYNCDITCKCSSSLC